VKKVIKTPNAPAAIGPYSQAVVHHGIVYCSGQISLDPDSMQVTGNNVESQAKQVMENIGQILQASGSDYSKVLKSSIFLVDIEDFAAVNKIYGSYFDDSPPARETIAVKALPKNVLVEISCIAAV